MNNLNSKIVHISDPHFGTEDEAAAEKLVQSINEISPDLIVLSGDLTQRALRKQFENVSAFLDRLPFPQIIIPGNHDIPLYNFVRRFTDPFGRFNEYFPPAKYREYQSSKLAVIGINSSTPLKSQSGRVTREDIERIKDFFAGINGEKIKGVAVHHNIIPHESLKGSSVLVNGHNFISELNKCGVDLIFAGHLHKTLTATYNTGEVKSNLLMLQSGTCMSQRLRKEENSYFIVKTSAEEIRVEFMKYSRDGFRSDKSEVYIRGTD